MPSTSDSNDLETIYNERIKKLRISYPVCKNFVANRDDKKFCVCNRSAEEHFRRGKRRRRYQSDLPDLPPSRSSNAKHQFTAENEHAHGQLVSGAWFTRFDKATPIDRVQGVLNDVWELPQPKLIMSVIGGTKHFTLNERFETNFTNSIISLATRSDIWLITNGYDNGVAQLIGQAVHKAKYREPDKQAVAIGICKWGGIKTPMKLVKQKKNDRFKRKSANVSDSSSSDDADDDDERIRPKEEKKRTLDVNLSHYLICDDGIYGNPDIEDFRTRLCDQLRQQSGQKHHVPMVTLVVEGGDSTIENIYNDLKTKIPVVIIDGSGRVADFFSRWLTYTKDLRRQDDLREVIFGIEELKGRDRVSSVGELAARTTNERPPSHLKIHQVFVNLNDQKLSDIFSRYKDQLRKDLAKVLYPDEPFDVTYVAPNDNFEQLYQKVLYCLQPSVCSNITIFSPYGDNDLSETIFRSISESYQKSSSKVNESGKSIRDTLLDLAMDWNCIDVAKEFAFENSLTEISNEMKVFLKALKRNLFTFVYEFLKLGLDPTEIFFPNKTFSKNNGERYRILIDELYTKDVLESAKTDLTNLIENDNHFIDKQITTVADLNIIFRKLIGDYMHKLYYDSVEEEYRDREHDGLILKSKERRLGMSYDAEYEQTQSNEGLAHDYIMRDLFLWSILMNYIDMAKVFLSFMKYRICPALIASKILKSYKINTPQSDKQDEYEENAKYFEQYAIDCLDYCDDINVDKACEIIFQQNEVYGYVTCAQVAANAHDKNFLGEPCCEEVMNNIWFDKLLPMKKTTLNVVKLVIALLTLGLAAPLLSFRKYERETTGETLQKKFRTCGINYSDPYPIEYPRRFGNHHGANHHFRQINNFHRSPMVKFCYHLIIYVFFLLLFSYVLLFKFSPPTDQKVSIDWTEILTIIFVSCLLIEELRYFASLESLTIKGKIKHYFRDIFKWGNFLALLLFYIGLFLRFLHADNEDEFIAARVVMALDIELWWLGFLGFVIVIPELGPHLVAIQKMLRDLGFFILIIVIVMAGYGVTTRSMYYYQDQNGLTEAENGTIDTSFDGRSVFRQIMYPVYYFLHGEFGSELDNLDKNPNAAGSIASHVLFAAQMLFVNILLTNLLIAMFSKRFEEVYEDTRNIWLYQTYLYTREYYIRSPFFPPLSIFYDFFYLCRRLFFSLRKICKKNGDRNRRVFKIIPRTKSTIKEWQNFEDASTYEYSHYQVKLAKLELTKLSNGQEKNNEKDSILNDFNNTTESVRIVQEDVNRLNATLEGMKADLRIRRSR